MGISYSPAPKMKFSIKYFLSKFNQIPRKLQIWSHLLKTTLVENFVFWAVSQTPAMISEK